MFLRSFLLLFTALGLLLASGCRDEKIETYRVPKETPPSASPNASMAMADTTGPDASAAPAGGPLTWQAPASWTAKALGSMRKGSYSIQGDDGATADVSVISFPGTAGGLAENINRWRGQLKLPSLPDDQISADTTTLTVGDLNLTVVDLSGQGSAGPARILGAILPVGAETWFFKLMGPAALAEKSKPDFLSFLKTIQKTSPNTDLAAAGPDAPPPAVTAAEPTGPVTWQAPSEWTPKALGAMRKGSFLVKGDDGSEADVSIISFPGAAGGLAENINRWRGQLKLPPLADSELAGATTQIVSGDLKFTVVDFNGQGSAGPARILGAIMPLGAETYFFKLIGPADLVEKSKPAFLDFLKTVKNR